MLRTACLLGVLLLTASAVQAQEDPTARLLERYERARTVAWLWEQVDGTRLVPAPPAYVHAPVDTLLWWARARWTTILDQSSWPALDWPSPDTLHAPFVPADRVVWEWRAIPPAARSRFLRRTADVHWTRGSYRVQSALDTLETAELRARLEAELGQPTVTVIEQLRDRQIFPEEYVQFEYRTWVNREVPVRIVDVNGPLSKGVLLLVPETFADWIPLLRQTLEQRLLDAAPTPFADFYLSPSTGNWLLVGYDGDAYTAAAALKPDPRNGRPTAAPSGATTTDTSSRPNGRHPHHP